MTTDNKDMSYRDNIRYLQIEKVDTSSADNTAQDIRSNPIAKNFLDTLQKINDELEDHFNSEIK